MKTRKILTQNFLLVCFLTLAPLFFPNKISAQCTASFTYSISGNTITFTNTSTPLSGGNFLWTFGDGTTSNVVHPVHTYSLVNGAQNVIVCLTLVYGQNCYDKTCDTIFVSPATGLNDYSFVEQSFFCYPNPSNTFVQISYSTNETSNIELIIYDLLGKKIATIDKDTKIPGKYTVEWNTEIIPSGIYILQLRSNNFVITKKIVVKH